MTDSARFGHERCLLCGAENPLSLRLRFESVGNCVKTRFKSSRYLQGYEGILHGGVIAALLDAAMAHCLFHHDIRAVTAELTVRFIHPVRCGCDLELRACIESRRPPLFKLSSQLVCDGRTEASSEAKFLLLDTPSGVNSSCEDQVR